MDKSFYFKIVFFLCLIFLICFYEKLSIKNYSFKIIQSLKVNNSDLVELIQIKSESDCECKKDEFVKVMHNENNSNFQIIYENKHSNGSKSKVNYEIKSLNHLQFTCNLFDSLRRGKDQKVLSYSLYGNNPLYFDNLRNLTKLIKKMYPTWTIRIYHDDTIKKSIKCNIECQEDDIVDFCNINKLKKTAFSEKSWSASYMHKMAWRWLPIGDSFVNTFSSRDSDSIIIQRELDSVKVWLESNKSGHIMRGSIFILNIFYSNLYIK